MYSLEGISPQFHGLLSPVIPAALLGRVSVQDPNFQLVLQRVQVSDKRYTGVFRGSNLQKNAAVVYALILDIHTLLCATLIELRGRNTTEDEPSEVL
ncbi:hypothetical protein AAC03nite_35940 [Alicyclobacillus acidoterrestris]|nr:hypothetical protein AAC03nite_35940 [Alicyclobacillus acidoterrestris]